MTNQADHIPAHKWRVVVRVMNLLVTAAGVLVLWAIFSFVRYRDFDFGVALQVGAAVVIVVYMRALARKRLFAAKNEQNG